LAIDQIAQSGLSSLSVIYYSAQLFSTSPNNWLVFMQNGQEVVIDSGKSVSLTLTMAPAFKDEGELTDMTDITGNLTVLVEAK
ncbi:hypothetical protein AB7V73_16750, partial [Escherichia coli]|nr:hypothetical protein [Escherichia coli]